MPSMPLAGLFETAFPFHRNVGKAAHGCQRGKLFAQLLIPGQTVREHHDGPQVDRVRLKLDTRRFAASGRIHAQQEIGRPENRLVLR